MYRCWAPFYLLIGTSFCILSYLDKSPFKSFSILKLCYPSFCYWPEKVFHVFWVQLPYIWFHALIFSHSVDYLFYFLFFLNIYLFSERGEGRDEGRERNIMCERDINPLPLAPPSLAHNPGMCPNWELNWWPFSSQAGTQSTEPHQPGVLLNCTAAHNRKKVEMLN